MTLSEFTLQISSFATLGNQDKLIHFIWYLHNHADKSRVQVEDLRNCYSDRSEENHNIARDLVRLSDKRPKLLLKDNLGYYLEHKVRAELDAKYGLHETTIALSQMLKGLPGLIADKAERLFLSEAITCYHNKAFRAAIVMSWNLAYDHVLRWILKDHSRLAAFNGEIVARVGAKKGSGILISKREDFEALGEQEVLDICNRARLFTSSNTKKLLDIQLTKRNLAAHPSLLAIDGPQADDTISSLVTNVVLELR